MAEPAPQPWAVEAFFDWQERQAERYELVGGFPLKMMVGVRNVHDDVVVNILAELRNRLRGGSCKPFTGESAIETLPGQIRRPDLGVDCGRRDPNAFKAAEPRMVVEVLSPGTRDFDTFEKLGEYKTVETLDHIVFVDPDCAEVVHWMRTPDRRWTRRVIDDLDGALDLPDLGVSVPLRDIYDEVVFPPLCGPGSSAAETQVGGRPPLCRDRAIVSDAARLSMAGRSLITTPLDPVSRRPTGTSCPS